MFLCFVDVQKCLLRVFEFVCSSVALRVWVRVDNVPGVRVDYILKLWAMVTVREVHYRVNNYKSE